MDALGSTHRHGGFVHHHPVRRHMATNRAGCRHHMLEIGRTIFIRGRADRNELQGTEFHRLFDVGGETQAAGSTIALYQLGQTRLMDGDTAVIKDADFLGIQIQAHHMVADLGKTSTGNKADIAGSDHGDFHRCTR